MAGFLDALRAFFNPAPGFAPNPDNVPYGAVWVSEEERVLTSQSWAAGLDWTESNSAAGEMVDIESSLRTIAFQAGVRLLVNDIAALPVDAYRKVDLGREELPEPAWVTTPNPSNPNYAWEDHVKQVVFSLLTSGESFVRCFPSVRAVAGLGVIPASNVADVKADGLGVRYELTNDTTLTPDEVIHIPWVLPPGSLRGLNPIEAAREGLGIAIASDKFVGSYFGNGAILSGWIKFPAGADPTDTQVKGIKDDFKRKHVGAARSHAVGALTGGAEFVPFNYSNKDAQLLELRESVVEDVARLLGIPPHMLGSQKPGAVGYASVEQRSIDYVTHAVLPIVHRMETGYSRLLYGQQRYLRFNVEGLKRGDQAARAAYYREMASIKALRRDEIRKFEDLPYDADAVGYLETPNNNAPQQPAARSLDIETRPQEPSVPVVVNLNAESVRMDPPTINLPEMPAPVVHVTVPQQEAPVIRNEITVPQQAAPEIRVDVAPQHAPVVNVNTPDTLRITAMPKRRTSRSVTRRDAVTGSIVETTDVEEDV